MNQVVIKVRPSDFWMNFMIWLTVFY